MLWQTEGAFVRYRTSATSATITSYNTIDDEYPNFAEIGVRADGADVGVAELAAEGEIETVVVLPVGADKEVDIIVGAQSKPPNTLIGTWLVDVSFNADATKLSPDQSTPLWIYGDSIASGGNADNPSLQSWVQLVRNARQAAVAGATYCEAWGYRSLYDDCVTAAARGIFVANCVPLSPTIIWLAIGTNDYGLNKWSAAAFGVAYAALLDDLHTALPAATIYAMTPFLRSVEIANGSGSTLQDYRDEIATAQSTRGAWCTLVDGTAILVLGDLDDGVHPTTAGHVKIATAVNTILGL